MAYLLPQNCDSIQSIIILDPEQDLNLCDKYPCALQDVDYLLLETCGRKVYLLPNVEVKKNLMPGAEKSISAVKNPLEINWLALRLFADRFKLDVFADEPENMEMLPKGNCVFVAIDLNGDCINYAITDFEQDWKSFFRVPCLAQLVLKSGDYDDDVKLAYDILNEKFEGRASQRERLNCLRVVHYLCTHQISKSNPKLKLKIMTDVSLSFPKIKTK